MRSAVFAAAIVVAGCGVKEDASLFVYANNTTLTKGTGPFGDKLDGSVDVVFDLGKYTQESVTLESIQIGMYRNNAQIVPAAKFDAPAGTAFPLVLAPGQKHTIKFVVSRPQLLPDETTALCAGPVTITGAAKQSGKGELQIAAQTVTVSGC